jgi:transposase
MSKKENQRYTPEFRLEALKLVSEQGMSVAQAAQRLNMSVGTLASWNTQARKINLPQSPEALNVTELTAELKQLRKELAETKMERDILKKATAYFARESLPSTRS